MKTVKEKQAGNFPCLLGERMEEPDLALLLGADYAPSWA
jgi:hypothetical protein